MADLRFLKMVYQQWSDGQSDRGGTAVDFVEMASRLTGTPQDQLMKELQTCVWFNRSGD